MEVVNGEFFMVGCDPEDPSALHSPADAAALIHRIGFLPLFSTSIPGVSIEEHVPAECWWTGDGETDPWEWRQVLAVDPSIAYGKFFNRTAGFVSGAFFPVFANYRRNGYDFDALFEDELASYRAKKIMDAFETDEEGVGKALLSSEIRELAGKDETTLAELQIQTYLIISDFRQRKNKKGQEYGWHLAVMETPESKWGRAHVAGGYAEEPEESWKRIEERMKRFYPEADEKAVRKMLGIRHPGETVQKARETAKAKKPAERRILRPQQLPWPENLVTEIGLQLVYPETGTYAPLTDDQMVGLLYAMGTLKDKEQTGIRLRYEEHRTFRDTGDHCNLSTERIRQIIVRGIRKLRTPSRLCYIADGYQGVLDKREKEREKARELLKSGDCMKILAEVAIVDLKMSVRAERCLSRAGMSTLADVVKLIEKDPDALIHIRHLGAKTRYEIVEKLKDYGIDYCDGGQL